MLQQQEMFHGTWILNQEKSRFDPNHHPKEALMRLERTELGYELRAEGTKDDGTHVVENATFILDGQERPVAAAPGVIQVATLRDPNTIEVVGKKEGQVVGKATYAVSRDGQLLTATVWGTDVEQRAFSNMVVWDRQ